MKKQKTLGLALFASAAMLLAACGGPSETGKSEPSKSQAGGNSTPTSVPASIDENLPKYDVVIKDAAGAEISNEKISLRQAITKPADPAAPAGKVFYGWKNTKNGGQIWDFEEDHKLNQVMGDVELVPMFVPANMQPTVFEAELCPEITQANGGTGMDGATYSGGAKGKQFVGRTYDGEAGATSVASARYYEVYANAEEQELEIKEGLAELTDPQETGKIYAEKTKEFTFSGALVHFNYKKGNVLSFKINSPAAETGVSLIARFSAEYGKALEGADYEDTIDAFDDEDFQVKVNGTAQKYGNVAIHNIVGTSGAEYIYCQDYYMGDINLVAGENTIELVVNNDKTLNGTIAASAPCIDSVKLFSNNSLTWPTARYTNLIADN